ncbi:ribosome recycling factor [Candidatus Roizmanbacteria bacterium CG_4_10_14_0_8_um_filter_33_9]|uniref:Ribosome recycling factor n=1 Tax=Candidatus Roizmanbacteria bacterium CG_4_10_14_0_8_um_filter_33_9 TaxID=1974826 RepID=A0A2M7QIC0_9BACT|nr:MAG: ribosome recycling factor [Candidatus Roizmanbacteria bacterium CG_4_10_14_0_8_um_filter_33_9]
MDLNQFKTNLTQTLSHLKEQLKTIRTGRANPSIIEDLAVETYGGSTILKLKELATIVSEGPSALIVAPFDPSTIQDIEKAILKSPLGLTPATQGSRITLRIPAMSQEQREKYIKLVGQMIEEKRVIARNHRDDVRKKIKELFDSKETTEDEKYRVEKEIDTISQKAMEDIQTLKDLKETEIKEI